MSSRSLSILLVFSIALTACSHAPSSPARRVILISCDTLRADHLGVYGYARPTSPNVDAFAEDALVFDDAYCSAPVTGPSFSSLFSGKLPDELGVPGGNKFLMGADVVTLPEIFSEAGIATAAVVSNWVLRRMEGDAPGAGVAQGFQFFDDKMERTLPNRDLLERVAPDTTNAAIEWLTAQKRTASERFFLWVHYQDPHGPYVPPAASMQGLERPMTNEPLLTIGSNQKGKGQLPMYQAIKNEERPEDYRQRYDGEIRYFDEHFGRLIDWLKKNDWYDDTLIVFTSDHGESLGEHGYWFCHGENLHQEEVHVPFVVKYPKGAAHPASVAKDGRQHVANLVGHMDLWSTFLAAFALPPRPNRGTSLLTTTLPAARVNSQVIGSAKSALRWVAVSDGRFRLMQQFTDTPRLYDVLADPGETHDLALEQPGKVQELVAALSEYTLDQADTSHAPAVMKMTPENKRILNGNGYAGDDEH